MKVVHEECGSKKTTIRLTFDAGSNVEYGGRWTPGIAHLVEHMVFQSSKSMSHEELVRKMASLGAEWNAATWNDKVSFFVVVPQENSLEAAKLLKEMLFNRDFDNDEFEKEKLVVLEEERGSKDDLANNIWEEIFKFICKGPMAAPIIGTEKSIKSISLGEVHAFHETHYVPEKTLLSITGPKNINVKSLIKIFGKNDGIFLKTQKEKSEYSYGKKKVVKDEKIQQQSKLFVFYKSFPKSHKSTVPMIFLQKFFSEDLDSRLFQEVRQKHGLCYGTGGYSDTGLDLGWFNLWAFVSPENTNKVLKIFDFEIQKLLNNGPTEEEMERARNKYISEIYTAIETSHGLNSFINSSAFYGSPNVNELLQKVKNIKMKDLRNAYGKVFRPENKQVFIYMPK